MLPSLSDHRLLLCRPVIRHNNKWNSIRIIITNDRWQLPIRSRYKGHCFVELLTLFSKKLENCASNRVRRFRANTRSVQLSDKYCRHLLVADPDLWWTIVPFKHSIHLCQLVWLTILVALTENRLFDDCFNQVQFYYTVRSGVGSAEPWVGCFCAESTLTTYHCHWWESFS